MSIQPSDSVLVVPGAGAYEPGMPWWVRYATPQNLAAAYNAGKTLYNMIPSRKYNPFSQSPVSLASGGGAYPYGGRRFAYYSPQSRRARGYRRIPNVRERVYKGFTRSVGWYGRFGPNSFGPPELKFLDNLLSATNVGGGLLQPTINPIAGGSTESTRVGRRVTLRYLEFAMRVVTRTLAAGTERTRPYRIVVYIDHQCNGATATGSDLFENFGTLTNDEKMLAKRNLINQKRFTFLYDRTFIMRPDVAFTSAGAFTFNNVAQDRIHKFNTKLNCPIEFNGVTGAISEICCNNIGWLIVEGFSGGLQAECLTRVRFSDN